MVNKRINQVIHQAKLAFGHSKIEIAEKDYYNWSPNRNKELKRKNFFSRESQSYICSICGKEFVELDSLKTPVYLRYRNHFWLCDKKEFESNCK